MVATSRTRPARPGDPPNHAAPGKLAAFSGVARYASGISDAVPTDAQAPNPGTELGHVLAVIYARHTVLCGIRDNLASLVQNLDGPDMEGAVHVQELKPQRLGVLPQIMEALSDQDEVLKQIGQYAARLEQLA